jgi:LPXTG-site transpeptidase (sortase) family protein
VKKIANFLIILGFFLLFLTYLPVIRDEAWYLLKTRFGQNTGEEYSAFAQYKEVSVFANFLFSKPSTFNPVNKDFAIVIEKIGVNAPIKADVSVMDPKAYQVALKEGVAHASRSLYPSQTAGNVYLFAHSSVNFWQLGKYATVFNLLRKLEVGDRVHIYYKNQDFVYAVVSKEILKGWDTFPLTRSTIEPILTLQTCDPPGTTLNRLVVTAKLVEVR